MGVYRDELLWKCIKLQLHHYTIIRAISSDYESYNILKEKV